LSAAGDGAVTAAIGALGWTPDGFLAGSAIGGTAVTATAGGSGAAVKVGLVAADGGLAGPATTGGVRTEGFSVKCIAGGLAATIGGFAIATTSRELIGEFFATVTTRWSGPMAKGAVKITAHVIIRFFQRPGLMEQWTSASRQKSCWTKV